MHARIHVHTLQAWGPMPGGGNLLPGEMSPTALNGAKLPPINRQGGHGAEDPHSYGDSYLGGQGPYESDQPQQDGVQKGGSYAHVQSKVAQNAAEVRQAVLWMWMWVLVWVLWDWLWVCTQLFTFLLKRPDVDRCKLVS